ncbi:MAG: glycosyltransferase family 4 protein [Alphaproteobacteria bacterium]|nr:glycosyltransferase family 4 protein [Alphaproteobacteria bacterium]
MSASPRTILFPFSGESVGGSHISSVLIAKNLDTKKYKPLFVLSADSLKQQNLLKQHGLTFTVRPDLYVPHSLKQMLFHLPRFISGLIKAKRYLKENDIALIHCDNGPQQYLWFYAGALAGTPYLHVQRNPLRLTRERHYALCYADAVIANSKFTQGTLPALPRDVLQDIIPPLIEMPEQLSRKQNNEQYVIGFLSNMQARKRPELFLEMAHLIKEQAPDTFRFVMAGAFYDDYEARLKALTQHYDLQDDVTFTGFVDNPQEILAGFDILVAPAESEAFGRVLVEAMALGVPVIAADSGGHSEIIEDGVTGALCQPGDAAGFARAVLYLHKNPALQERLTTAARAAIKQYEAPAIAKRFEDIYRRIEEKTPSA